MRRRLSVLLAMAVMLALTGVGGTVLGMVFSPDGKLLAAAFSLDGELL